MIPILYDKTGNNKLGELHDIIEGSFVEEERNGLFNYEFEYPNDYPLADLLVSESMVEVKPNDEQNPQKFRIYDTKKMMDSIILVFARHESFDLANDHVENIKLENASCEYALNTLFRNSHFSQAYRGYSDVINAQNYAMDNSNVINAIAGKEGSIVDTYGTGVEILRNNKEFHVLNKRGHDNGVTIEYGKNLTGFELDADLTDLETRCGGFAKYRPDGAKDDVIVKSDWIDSPFIVNFAHPYINRDGRRDYSDKFKDGVIPTKEALNKLCSDEFKINKRDIPKSNYKIEFIPLSKCVGYEEVQDKISLCDIVTIKDYRFNVDTKAKVIKYKYDPIKERYISMELGEPRTTLGDIIGGSGGTVGPPGKDGIDGKPGADGNIEDFPNILPNTPTLKAKVLGFASIDLSWTYEDKVYYTYELYTSKTKDFTPNVFDLIHKGQSSSFLYQAKPMETWYFRVCAVNTHGNRTAFSPQIEIVTKKVDAFGEYFSNLAVGNLVTHIFTTEYMEAGIVKGSWIDAKHLSVTDGNGKRTLDIDSFGNITLMPSVFKMLIDGKEQDVITENRFTSTIKGINQTLTKIEGDYVSQNSLNSTVDGIEIEISKTGVAQLIPNGAMQANQKFWYPWQSNLVFEINPNTGTRTMHVSPKGNGNGSFGVQLPACDLQANKYYTVCFWVESNSITDLNYNFLMNGNIGYQKIGSTSFNTSNGILTRVAITFKALYDRNTCILIGFEGNLAGKYFRISEACCYEGTRMYPYKPCPNEIYNAKTFFDMEGLGVRHDDGSEFKATSEELKFTDIQARKKMAIKKGSLYAYDVKTGELMGMFASNKVSSTYKGVTTGLSGSAHYYAIGATKELTDDDELNMVPYILIAQQDLHNFLGHSVISGGINFLNTPCIFHQSPLFKMSPRFEGGFAILDSNWNPVNIYHAKNSIYVESNIKLPTGGSFYGGGLYGNDITSIGYNLHGTYTDVIKLYSSIQQIDFLRPLNMNYFGIFNSHFGFQVINNNAIQKGKIVENVFDEIEVIPSLFKENNIGWIDVSNVTNKDEVMINEDNADLGKLVTLLFKEVKALKEEIKQLKAGV